MIYSPYGHGPLHGLCLLVLGGAISGHHSFLPDFFLFCKRKADRFPDLLGLGDSGATPYGFSLWERPSIGHLPLKGTIYPFGRLG